jgi:hypothetical protein
MSSACGSKNAGEGINCVDRRSAAVSNHAIQRAHDLDGCHSDCYFPAMEEPRPPLFIPPLSLLLVNLFTRPSLRRARRVTPSQPAHGRAPWLVGSAVGSPGSRLLGDVPAPPRHRRRLRIPSDRRTSAQPCTGAFRPRAHLLRALPAVRRPSTRRTLRALRRSFRRAPSAPIEASCLPWGAS